MNKKRVKQFVTGVYMLLFLISCQTTKSKKQNSTNGDKLTTIKTHDSIPFAVEYIQKGHHLEKAIPLLAIAAADSLLNNPEPKLRSSRKTFAKILYQTNTDIYWTHLKTLNYWGVGKIDRLYRSPMKEYNEIVKQLSYLDRQMAIDLVIKSLSIGGSNYSFDENSVNFHLVNSVGVCKVVAKGKYNYSNHWVFDTTADGERQFYVISQDYLFSKTIADGKVVSVDLTRMGVEEMRPKN